MKKRQLAALLLSAAVIMNLAGCSSSGSSSSESSSSSDDAEETADASSEEGTGDAAEEETTEDTAADASADGSDGEEKILYWANNENTFTDLDEVNNYAVFNQKLVSIYADTLFSTDHAGNYEAWIATDWSWNDDSTVITITVRDDVTFQCGEPLTAEDVAFTYQRIVDNYADLVNPTRWSKLTGAEAIDDYTVELSFSSPMPVFMSCASQIPIICKTDYEASPDTFFSSADFCTSGPFAVTDADFINTVVELTRNDSWWAWDEETKTNIDKIIYQNVTEDTTRVSSLRTGEITLAENVPYADLTTLESEGFTINSYAKDEHVYMVLNCNEGKIFTNEAIREAVSLCIDRELLVSSILGNGTAATWPCIEGDVGYVADSGYEYDLEAAQALVEESGYDGEEIDMILSSGVLVQGEEVAQAIQAMCAEAGLNVNLEIMETATFNERKMAGDYDVCLSAWTNSMGDPYNELVEILGSTDMFSSGLVNQELYDLVDEITVTADEEEREALMQEAFGMVMDQFGPDIYLYDCTSNLVYSPDLTNVTVYSDSVMDFRYAQMN